MIDDRSQLALRRFYKQYFDAVNSSRKRAPASLILASLEVKSNVRQRLLRESAISAEDVDNIALRSLVASRLVRETDKPDHYVITGLGIWYEENQDGIVDTTKLLEWVDHKFFDLFADGSGLAEKEKVITLALLAVRAFSAKSAIDLFGRDDAKKATMEVLEQAREQLKSLGVVKTIKNTDLFREIGTELPLSHLLRHTDDLPKKTRGYFSVEKPQKYYLDVAPNGEVDMDRVVFLFQRVLEHRISASSADGLAKWCAQVAFREGLLVFDQSTHQFGKPEVDDLVAEAIQRASISRGSSG